MREKQQMVEWICMAIVVCAVGAGCTYTAVVQRLPPVEQAEFFVYRKVMTWTQERAYLAEPTAAARTAYLSEIGLTQRFQALDPLDQEAIRHGWPRPSMSADALLFLWGEPYYTAGDANRSAHWYYLGSSLGLAEHGNQYQSFGNRVDVYLVDGRVVGWVDYAPSDAEPARGFPW